MGKYTQTVVDDEITKLRSLITEGDRKGFHPQESKDHIFVYRERNGRPRRSEPLQRSFAFAWLSKARKCVAERQKAGDLDRWGEIELRVEKLPECVICGRVLHRNATCECN